jgi:CheY-like chemotaxis protein
MDHMMPVMDGIEALQIIRAKPGSFWQNVPVIALTANAVVGMKEMFFQKGFNDYLSKPIDISKLDEVLSRWIPKGKQQKPDKEETVKKESDSSTLRIEGLDVKHGLEMTGSTEDIFLDILGTYVKDAEERLGILKGFQQTMPMAPVDEKALSTFITQVHSLKSASASIGATEMSAKALILETAGRNRDVAFIKQNLPIFCLNLSALIRNIQDTLPRPEQTAATDISSEDKLVITQSLLLLKEALETENIGIVDAILEDLKCMPCEPDLKEALSNIEDDVLVSDFAEALEVLQAKVVKKQQ